MTRALALAMIGLAAPAAAAPGPITYQCTAPFWDESGLWQTNAGPLRRASGQITVEELEDIPTAWPPSRELRFTGPVRDMRRAEVMLSNSRDDIHVSVTIVPSEGSGDALHIWLHWEIGDSTDGRRLATVPRRRGALTRIPFTMLVESQQVVVEAAGVRAEAPATLGSEIEFRASCQGGEFMFYALDWGG